MSWEYVQIESVCTLVDGDRGKNYPKKSDFRDEGDCLFLDAGNVTKDGFDFSSCSYITAEKDGLLRAGKLSRNDVVLTTRGTLGNVGWYSEAIPFPSVRINSGMLILRVGRELLPSYLYYCLRSDYFQSLINGVRSGSAQPQLPAKTLKQMEIPLPPLQDQQRISSILMAYDNLIENNRRQIALLEEAAQRLYKEWFVDLRFPGHESIEISKGLPSGWAERRLADIADVVMGQSPKSEYYNDTGEGLPFHQGVSNYGLRFVQDGTYTTSVTRIGKAGSILFSVRAPVGRLNYTKNEIVLGRGLAAMNHRQGLQSYLYYMLKERFFKEDMIGNGSIFASISKGDLLSQRFVVPDNALAERFNTLCQPVDRQIERCDDAIRAASEVRDRLLSKLMSGEIEV